MKAVEKTVISPKKENIFLETDMLFDLGEDSINWLVSKVPMQRSGTPDEVGETAMFLLSDEASYISGAEIVVDGALITR